MSVVMNSLELKLAKGQLEMVNQVFGIFIMDRSYSYHLVPKDCTA